jgi:hypothetical protein
VEFYERAREIWLDLLKLPTDLRRDLTALFRIEFLPSSDWVSPEAFARYGVPSVIPLITTAAFVQLDVRDGVVDAIGQIGEPAGPALMSVLEQPLFGAYWAAWRRAGMADTGAVSEGMSGARYTYARALEGLHAVARQAPGAPPWFPAAQRVAFAYRELPGLEYSDLRGPAHVVVEDVRVGTSLATGTWEGMGREVPAPPGTDIRNTGLWRSLEQRQRHLQEESARAAEEARLAEFAGFYLADQQRRKSGW